MDGTSGQTGNLGQEMTKSTTERQEPIPEISIEELDLPAGVTVTQGSDMNRVTLNDERDYLEWRQGSGDTLEIYDIVVGSERRKGKGRLLVQTVLGLCKPYGAKLLWAITRASNGIAQDFYSGVGFRVIARLNKFYQGEDAIMYGKDVRA